VLFEFEDVHLNLNENRMDVCYMVAYIQQVLLVQQAAMNQKISKKFSAKSLKDKEPNKNYLNY